MKKIYALLLIIATLFAFTSYANTVYVYGVVKNNGVPVANKAVRVWADSSVANGFCYQIHLRYTNANGMYADTLNCNLNIPTVKTSIDGCNGAVVINTTQVNANFSAESNFNLSCTTPTGCVSNFFVGASTAGGTPLAYLSSQATPTAGDLITKYKWVFGDGSSDSTTSPSPFPHVYPAYGSYQTCLTITTAFGCTKTECKTVVLIDSSVLNCHANFTLSGAGAAPSTIQFTSTSTFVTGGTAATFSWHFGDGSSSSTISNPVHVYTAPGNYNVCLRIASSTGCIDSICKTVTITNPVPACNAEFQFALDSPTNYKLVRFYAGVNTAYPNNDPVVERKWRFGDGDSLTGNVQNPTHTYANAGTYTVCLRVKTQSGCISELCKTVVVAPPPFVCTAVAAFTYIPVSSLVKFNSNVSTPGANDTIISRKWVFGDSTVLTGNVVDPQHQYAHPGIYNVCLTIKTVKGCERTFCAIVTATNVNSNCVPQFTYQRIAPKKVAFNSTMSWIPVGDSIIERKWTFGDGVSLTGTTANPTHEYNNYGIYTVCLRIKTALGCVNEVCKPVIVQDSIVQPPAGTNEPIKIISLYPNPVTIQMNTVVWSYNNNVAAELSIYDIYGVKKWSLNKTLLQGNNFTVIPTGFLANGPYFFRVTTSYGVKSRAFYKM